MNQPKIQKKKAEIMEDYTKICPLLKGMKDKEDIQKCFREGCAWWDSHYNCCAVLSSAILLEILAKRKSRWRRNEQQYEKGDEKAQS